MNVKNEIWKETSSNVNKLYWQSFTATTIRSYYDIVDWLYKNMEKQFIGQIGSWVIIS